MRKGGQQSVKIAREVWGDTCAHENIKDMSIGEALGHVSGDIRAGLLQVSI